MLPRRTFLTVRARTVSARVFGNHLHEDLSLPLQNAEYRDFPGRPATSLSFSLPGKIRFVHLDFAAQDLAVDPGDAQRAWFPRLEALGVLDDLVQHLGGALDVGRRAHEHVVGRGDAGGAARADSSAWRSAGQGGRRRLGADVQALLDHLNPHLPAPRASSSLAAPLRATRPAAARGRK